MYDVRSISPATRINGQPLTNTRSSDRMMRDFGKRLRAARISAGYESGAEFARDLGVETPRYRKYERGDAMPPVDILALISAMTGKSLDFLILGRSPRTD